MVKYTTLNQTFDQPHPLAVGKKGMVVGTSGALAVKAGLEALKQGGSAVDAALTTSLAQISLSTGCWVSYAGFMTMVYFDAETGKVYSMNAAYNTVQAEDDPLSIPSRTPSGRATPVPGFMAGVQAAHDRFGQLPFASLFDPSIYFAEEVFSTMETRSRHSDSVVAVDDLGNMAAIVHTINGGLWGSLGLRVGGISIPNSASFQ